MIGTLRIGKCTLKGVFRYRWESNKTGRRDYGMWSDWSISLWFKTYKAVGIKDFTKVDKWGKNLKTGYMVGIDFLVIKFWVTIDFGIMHLDIEE